ncbi:hypothetical protein EV182_008471, partial [Spiromyces aspiralis]
STLAATPPSLTSIPPQHSSIRYSSNMTSPRYRPIFSSPTARMTRGGGSPCPRLLPAPTIQTGWCSTKRFHTNRGRGSSSPRGHMGWTFGRLTLNSGRLSPKPAQPSKSSSRK